MNTNIEFYAGSVSGLVQNIIGHPFDTMKIYLQNQQILYTGSTVKSAFFQYYKGVLYPTTLSVITNGMTFQINGFLYNSLNINNHYVNGFFTGTITSPIVFAFDVGKIKRQMNQKLSWNSVFTTSGFWMTCCRESLAVSIYLGSYYNMRDKDITPIVSGGTAGFLTWAFTYPIDVIKNRQTSRNITVRQAFCMGKLWRGFSLCATRGVLVNSIGFYVYEITKTVLS